MIDLDPNIIDQDKIRFQKRKRLLKIFILPAIALTLISFFFLRIGLYNVAYSISEENQTYNVTEAISSLMLSGNIIEPYIPYYNRGVSKLHTTDFVEAESDFRESLKQNPPESSLCKIYVNLSLSIEMQADAFASNKQYDKALSIYNKSEAVLYENGCATKSKETQGSDKKAEQGVDRIETKRSRVVFDMNQISGSNSGGESENGSGSASEKEIKEIIDSHDNSELLNELRERQDIKRLLEDSHGGGDHGGGASSTTFDSRNKGW